MKPAKSQAATAAHPFLVAAGAVCTALVLGACQPPPPPPPPFKLTATTAELMRAVVDPSADILWGSVGSTVTIDGVEDFFPRTEEEWIKIENAATMLMESGNLLMLGDRARDQQEWMTRSVALVDAGQLARDAARSRNPDQIFKVGGDVFAACDNCHQLYWVEGADPDGEAPQSDGEKPQSDGDPPQPQ